MFSSAPGITPARLFPINHVEESLITGKHAGSLTATLAFARRCGHLSHTSTPLNTTPAAARYERIRAGIRGTPMSSETAAKTASTNTAMAPVSTAAWALRPTTYAPSSSLQHLPRPLLQKMMTFLTDLNLKQLFLVAKPMSALNLSISGKEHRDHMISLLKRVAAKQLTPIQMTEFQRTVKNRICTFNAYAFTTEERRMLLPQLTPPTNSTYSVQQSDQPGLEEYTMPEYPNRATPERLQADFDEISHLQPTLKRLKLSCEWGPSDQGSAEMDRILTTELLKFKNLEALSSTGWLPILSLLRVAAELVKNNPRFNSLCMQGKLSYLAPPFALIKELLQSQLWKSFYISGGITSELLDVLLETQTQARIDQTDLDAPLVERPPILERLSITSPTREQAKAIAKMTSLCRFDLVITHATQLQAIPEQIETLKLTISQDISLKELQKQLKRLPKLRVLHLNPCGTSEEINDRLFNLLAQQMPALEELVICYAFHIRGAVQPLAALPALRKLYFSRGLKLDDRLFTHLARHCPQVRELSVTFCPRVTGWVENDLPPLGVRNLSLDISNMTSRGLAELLAICPDVDSLSLDFNESKSLRSEECPVTEKWFAAIAQSLRRLHILKLEGIQGVTADALRPVLELPNMQLVKLDCKGVTTDVVKAMKGLNRQVAILAEVDSSSSSSSDSESDSDVSESSSSSSSSSSSESDNDDSELEVDSSPDSDSNSSSSSESDSAVSESSGSSSSSSSSESDNDDNELKVDSSPDSNSSSDSESDSGASEI